MHDDREFNQLVAIISRQLPPFFAKYSGNRLFGVLEKGQFSMFVFYEESP